MSEKKPLKLLKVKEAADVLGISVSTMNDLYYRGEVRHVRVGRRSVRFRESDLEKYIEANTSICGQPR
jgi:excisionase family DNA binding protein